MKKDILKTIALFSVGIVSVTSVDAKVTLPHFVTDSMVVQQKSQWTLTGKTDGARVVVTTSWNNRSVNVKPLAGGKFSVVLHTPKAGGPYTIEFDDGTKTVLHDIYSGEVWICSGQSNMEMPVGGWGQVMNYKMEIANAIHPDVRLLQVRKQTSVRPEEDVPVNMGGWRTGSPTTVENFSSVAYFYARDMAQRLGVHVGVIDCTWGGTPAEAWTSYKGVAHIAGFEKEVATLRSNGFDSHRMKVDYDNQTAAWMKLVDDMAAKRGVVDHLDMSADKTMTVPCDWSQNQLTGFSGIVAMQRTLDIPAHWAGKALTLHLGMIDDEDETYFNGVKIGQGSGYNMPRTYTVPADLVHGGKAVVTVKVTDFGGGGGICGDAADVVAIQDDNRLALSGTWNYRVLANFASLPAKPLSPESSSYPTVLYNAMLYPLHRMPVKGVLWYQGCANVGRSEQYAPLFKQLITDWRRLWGDDRLPFYFVQLAGFQKPKLVQPESEWAALRQSQADALSLKNTAMAVAIDLGEPYNIHPKNKQEVARRLALIALKKAYGYKDVVDKAPSVKSCKLKGNTAQLSFDGPLAANDGAVNGFIVRTPNGQWLAANAKQKDHRTIVVTSDSTIKAVKYNWADYPNGNLRGITGLPVPQFYIK